ncbi:hypothetical protein IJ843_08025 [bacterium]|nr:hypothetical protein [bacterium]
MDFETIWDGIGTILEFSILVLFVFICFSAGIEKYGIKGFFITLFFLSVFIGFGFWIYDLTIGQSFGIQLLAELVVGLTFYYALKYFLKDIF